MAWRLLPAFSLSARTSVCSVCGTEMKVTEDEGVFTCDVYIEGEGDIEICVSCIKEAARMVGLVDSEVVTETEAQSEELRQYAEDVYAELTARDATIDGLTMANTRLMAELEAARETTNV